MIKKGWQEFRKTGLVVIINQILHIFGWAIVYELNDKEEVVDIYPARVTFRGFDDSTTGEAYRKLSNYMHANSAQLLDEANEVDQTKRDGWISVDHALPMGQLECDAKYANGDTGETTYWSKEEGFDGQVKPHGELVTHWRPKIKGEYEDRDE